MEKSSIAMNNIKYLGYVVEFAGIHVNPEKSIDPQVLAHSSKHSSTKKFSWFSEFLSTIHTWLQPHCMAFESVDKRKWGNCLQMDTDTTTSF